MKHFVIPFTEFQRRGELRNLAQDQDVNEGRKRAGTGIKSTKVLITVLCFLWNLHETGTYYNHLNNNMIDIIHI